MLAAIILMTLLVLLLIGYAIWTRCRKGKCSPECEDMKAELKKYKDGDLKPITPAMVRARESIATTSTSFPHGADVDLERGEVDDYEAQRQARHEAALAAFSAPEPVKPSLFARAKGLFKGKDKGKQPETIELPPTNPADEDSEHRYFTVGGSPYDSQRDIHPALRRPEPAYTYREPTPYRQDAGPSHPRSKMTSFPDRTNRDSDISALNTQQFHPRDDDHDQVSPKGTRTYSAYLAEDWAPRERRREEALRDRDRASVVSSALNIRDPRHAARYENAQNVIAEGTARDSVIQSAVKDVNAVEGQLRAKTRLGGYGGLGWDPRGFENVAMAEPIEVEGKGKGKAVVGESEDRDVRPYQVPDWREKEREGWRKG